MSPSPSVPPTGSVSDYLTDGVRIAAILLVWSVLAAFFTYGVSEIGGTGSLFELFGPRIGALLLLTGVLNVLLYLLYRAIDYWHQYV